jgi:predicted nucleic acid-binding protein
VLVVDASLVVELSLDRVGQRASQALGGEELVAPCLLWSEAPSVLHELAFRGDISRELADWALKRFLEDEIEVDERRPEGLTLAAWRLADQFGWAKLYDARYVALAQLLDCRLVTVDMRLWRGTKHLGFVVTPEELKGF